MHTIEKKEIIIGSSGSGCSGTSSRFPTVIVTQNLDLMKTISREQLSDSRDMGFVHFFLLESVLESTKKRTTAN